MRVVLVNSPWIRDGDRYSVKAGARWAHIRTRRKTIPYYPFPFAMAYATAVLKQDGNDAVLIDAIAEELTTEQCLDKIKNLGPDLLVLETSTPSIQSDLGFCKTAFELIGKPIVFSGPHATALPEETLDRSQGFAVLRGEFDYTLRDLVRALSESKSMETVQGLTWKGKHGVISNPDRPLITDLDALPFPERDGLPMLRYTDPACKQFPNVSIITSRGCPHKCIFCLESTVFFHSPSFRTRSPVSVVNEMEFVIGRYGAREVYFDDSSFTVSHTHARSVSKEIIERGLRIHWSCMADANIDFETMEWMKKSGCTGLKFGVETADPEIMKKINKKLDLKKVKEFASNARKLGLYTHGTFMFGLPGESKRSIERTLEFAFSLKCTTSQFSVATPFPGTEFYAMAKRENWLITGDWSRFDGGETPVISYDNCSAEDIKYGIEMAKKRKIINLITNPAVLSQYLWKLYKMKGFWGLMGEITSKAGYLIERRR
jgi:anaerobic magnesium-protoporphyrin IX monomethyl ester cyclase